MINNYVDMPQQVSANTIGQALQELEQCVSYTESLVNGNPMGEAKLSTGTVASAPLVRYRDTIMELTKRLAMVNEKLTLI